MAAMWPMEALHPENSKVHNTSPVLRSTAFTVLGIVDALTIMISPLMLAYSPPIGYSLTISRGGFIIVSFAAHEKHLPSPSTIGNHIGRMLPLPVA